MEQQDQKMKAKGILKFLMVSMRYDSRKLEAIRYPKD